MASFTSSLTAAVGNVRQSLSLSGLRFQEPVFSLSLATEKCKGGPGLENWELGESPEYKPHSWDQLRPDFTYAQRLRTRKLHGGETGTKSLKLYRGIL